MVSRGIPPDRISDATLWWHGPQWLQNNPETWPIAENMPAEVLERKQTPIPVLVASAKHSIFDSYSSLWKLQRVMAYILRFIHNCREPQERTTGFLTVSEQRDSRSSLLKMAQQESFPVEYKQLSSKIALRGVSKLILLNPFIATDETIRLGGRLKHANIDYDNKYPIILYPKHSLTKLLIRHEHLQLLHAGCQATLASFRTRYWPLVGKCAVKNVIKTCITCFKTKPPQSEYIMGDLPKERVTPTRPFLSSGVDYAGPFYVKEGNYRSKRQVKTYLCIFVCLSTRAVHLELGKYLSTEAFLNCLRRFINCRGRCHALFSDNGTNFVGARNQLKELGELLTNNEGIISNALSKQFIQWNMIPPRSPHFGGLWEVAVKSAKHHLTRIVGTAHLTYEELNTVIIQVEGCLNSRLISPLSSDSNDLTPLTRAHFLIGDSLQGFPHVDYPSDQTKLLSCYQRQQQMVKHFWDRWHKDYLQQLQHRPKWTRRQLNAIQEGALVIVQEDNVPPLRWKLGRITKLHPGSDGVTRVVTVRMSASEIKRPVKKVCVLPIEQ